MSSEFWVKSKNDSTTVQFDPDKTTNFFQGIGGNQSGVVCVHTFAIRKGYRNPPDESEWPEIVWSDSNIYKGSSGDNIFFDGVGDTR